jgi:predicted NBD/HSP70 family sugar kinase
VVVERYDVRGTRLAHLERAVRTPIDGQHLGEVIVDAVQAALSDASGAVLSCALSVAGPVDQRTGRLLHLPNSPFLLDELAPRELLDDVLPAGLTTDNDVNWAALAEHHEGAAQDLRQFFYCYLGPGIGGAGMINGAIVAGHRGLAGELAHVRTTGPGGRSLRLVECFAAWGLLQPNTDAIEVPRVMEMLVGATAVDRRRREAVVAAVAGALASVTAVLNPQAILVGGPWGLVDGVAERLGEHLHEVAPIDAEVRSAGLAEHAPLIGARLHAVRVARASLFDGLQTNSSPLSAPIG